jgi:hypothetical protein
MLDKATQSNTIMIEIFDPPMCCPSGLCGPSIDPALLDISEAILKMKNDFVGKVTIERYLLTQHGPKFMQNPQVLALLKSHGVEILPITTVNGEVLKQKAYPTYDELKSVLGEQANATN